MEHPRTVTGSPLPVSQTCEILVDDYQPGITNTQFSGQGYHAFRIGLLDSVNSSYNVPQGVVTQPVPYIAGLMPNLWTVLNNPTLGYMSYNSYNPFPGWPVSASNATPLALTTAFNAGYLRQHRLHPRRPLAPRVQRAGDGALNVTVPIASTNGTSTVPLSTYGNFRFNGPLQHCGDPNNVALPRPQLRGHGRGLRRLRPGELVPGDPERRRPGDDPVVPPAGDHPLRSQQPECQHSRPATGTRLPAPTSLGRFRCRGSSARSRPTATTRRPSPT